MSCVNSAPRRPEHFHGKHLFRGLQVFNVLIYTSKQPRKGIVLKEGGGGGSVMKDALFSLFLASGVGRQERGGVWGC